MEREQATLPFVVPSHLSKLFGLKASVIVEGEGAGGEEGSERQRKIRRERKRQCQGLIAPVGVMVRQLSWRVGGGTQEHTLSSTLSMHVFAKDSLSTRAPPLRPTFILL